MINIPYLTIYGLWPIEEFFIQVMFSKWKYTNKLSITIKM